MRWGINTEANSTPLLSSVPRGLHQTADGEEFRGFVTLRMMGDRLVQRKVFAQKPLNLRKFRAEQFSAGWAVALSSALAWLRCIDCKPATVSFFLEIDEMLVILSQCFYAEKAPSAVDRDGGSVFFNVQRR
jgi:hypothetical protein